MNQIKKNYMYNLVYQLLILIIPIITVPYVSRVLGVDGVGTYSYTYSIVYYFMLITMLGINNYGNRTIAKTRDNKNEMSKSFFSIYFIQLVMGILMIMSYLVYIFMFSTEYKFIATIQILYIFSSLFDINWFFFGLEKFKVTVIRNTIVKVLSLVLIFLFIKDVNDLWIYTLILAGSTLISQIILWPLLIKEINKVPLDLNDVKKHIKPCFILFLPYIAVSIYRTMDKIMLGSMINISEVGFYEQADKIINIPLCLITALGTVMMPRISNLVANGEKEKVLKYIEKSINFIMLVSIPICFGLIAVSDEFIPIFLGDSFDKTIILVQLLATTIIFIPFANVLRTQYILPNELDHIHVISIFSGALINLVFNLILIPKFYSTGAAIGTIVAEFTVMLFNIIFLLKKLPIITYIKESIKYLVTSVIMLVVILVFKNVIHIDNIVYRLIIEVLIGIVIYGILNIKNIKILFRNVMVK